MNIKPAGKIAIVVILVVGVIFVIRPLIGKKKIVSPTEVAKDSTAADSNVLPLENVKQVPIVPRNLRHEPQPKVVKPKPVEKPVEKPKPKKKGERENLNINM